MNSFRLIALAALLVVPAAAPAAETIVPQGTVIPVKLDTALDSGTSKAGSTLYATTDGTNNAGFPEGTRFVGTIESVTRASGKTAGEINIGFVAAKLPGGRQVSIQGQPISLDDKSVRIDEASGRMVGNKGSDNPTKFIAIGAGAGLLIGEVVDDKPLLGTIVGAAAGYLYGQSQAKKAQGKNVSVPEGTRFGVLLGQDVALAGSWTASTASWEQPSGDTGDGLKVTFANGPRPMTLANVLMVPYRQAMASLGIPFDYSASPKQVRVNENGALYSHTIGTRVVDVDGSETALGGVSRNIGGSLYVPVSYFEVLTGRTASWDRQSGVLLLQ